MTDLDDDRDDEPCEHDHDEECFGPAGEYWCTHQHCWNCGGCTCPGYCDDYQTYNLRPSETGGGEDNPRFDDAERQADRVNSGLSQ